MKFNQDFKSDLVKPSLNYKLIENEEAKESLISTLINSNRFSFDIETDGLNFNSDILGIGFCMEEGKSYYLPIKCDKNLDILWGEFKSQSLPPKIKKFRKFLDLKDYKLNVSYYWDDLYDIIRDIFSSESLKTAHNAKFDLKILLDKKIEVKNLAADSMIMSYLLDEKGKHSLKILSSVVPGFSGYELVVENITEKGKNSFEFVPLRILAEYCCTDADLTFRLTNLFAKEFREYSGFSKLLRNFYMPLINVFARAEIYGVGVDLDYLRKTIEIYEREMGEVKSRIQETIGHPINLNSSQQLSNYFFIERKLESVKLTPTGKPSVDAFVLEELANQDPVASNILEFRGKNKVMTTYLQPTLKYLDQKNRIHTSYLMHRIVTGRFSSVDPCLQNIPAETRRIFKAKDGCRFIYGDSSQMELRIMAWYSQDPTMLDCYYNKIDVHSLTASALFSIPIEEVNEDQRNLAKTVNFGIIYGASVKGLSKIMGSDESKAERFLYSYFSQFPKVKVWIEETKALARKNRYVENVYGRRRRFDSEEEARLAPNALIQGTASDFFKFNLIQLDKSLSTYNGHFLFSVHDSLLVECFEKDIGKLVPLVRMKMVQPVNPIDVPMGIVIKVQKYWGIDDESNI